VRLPRPISLAAGKLEVQFRWESDRWSHRVLVAGGQGWQSVDSIAEPPAAEKLGISPHWPASPVFTEVSLIDTETGPALLAIGRAGRSHFSASLVASQAAADTIVAELACRLQERPGWLGSAYQPLPDAGQAAPEVEWMTIRPPGVTKLPLPSTVVWSYHLTPAGIRAVPPASCERLSFRSD